MKKCLNLSLVYAIAVWRRRFYREFAKWNGYTGVTALGKVHTHLFLLGMVLFDRSAVCISHGSEGTEAVPYISQSV